ncbi:hypothetical protein [Ruminiclostridium hungatei]|nr:hypothetical protein [Ruminiclostridium hungatei]
MGSLSQLKKELQKGKRFIVLDHQKPDLIGTVREVSTVQGNAIYTKIADNPEHKHSICNGGRGLRMDYAKASCYEFGDSIKWFAAPIGTDDNRLIMEFKLL